MPVKSGVVKDMGEAMKKGEKLRTQTLRMLLSALKNKEIDLRREATDEEAFGVISTLIRQRHESVEQYRKGGREDLARKEEEEIGILSAYLPPQLTEAELLELVKKTAGEVGASSMKDMGKLMKELMPRVKGRAEGKAVNEAVKKVLGGA